MVAGLADIDGEDDAVPAGSVERSWLARRRMGVAEVAGCFIDIGHSGSLAVLNRALAGVARAHGLPELDAAAIRLSAPRAVTQRISRWVYDHSTPDGRRRYAGVRYASRLGDELANWAIFEPAAVHGDLEHGSGIIQPDDPDLVAAMQLHNLQWL